jgi:plastocyanin
MDKEYVVTLQDKNNLEQFYNEMQLAEFTLVLKRPMSRNTHYRMTEEQAEVLRQDVRVLGVEAVDSFQIKRQVINNEPYGIGGDFFKNGPGATTVNSNLRQWGHVHCAGDQAQRRKTAWGDPTATEIVTDNVEIFNTGRHVDVVIVDDPVSFDSVEWQSPSSFQTRFVEYQWFNELNSYVSSIDDDAQTLPTGTIVYAPNLNTSQYHGIHVTGTATGRHYGWANEANIYNIATTDPWDSGQKVGALLIFDYLRAFHLNKPINLETGIRNPTITNHSYGGIRRMPQKGVDENEEPIYRLDLADLISVNFQGVTYNSGSPGPSGWTEAGLGLDFGIRFGLPDYPAWSASVAADVQDAIDDGIVVIGSAGNDNLLVAEVGDINYNNYLIYVDEDGEDDSFYYNRGSWPSTPDSGSIIVGALSDHSDFRRSTYSMFGPAIDVFAPGDLILSSYGNTGTPDAKYGGVGNYYDAISGTSMASPQVCGVIACLATGKERFTQADAFGYLNQYSIYGDMAFNVAGGLLDDNSCRQGSPNKYLHIENPRRVSGYMSKVNGSRSTGLTFPRTATFNRPSPAPVPPTSQTYTFTVGNSGASHYTFTGSDRDNTFTNSNDPTINCNAGDTLVFNVSASGHPFYVKTSATTGTGNQVSTGTITGQGTVSAAVTWDTTGVTPGTYYYICQFHGGMVGQIIVS